MIRACAGFRSVPMKGRVYVCSVTQTTGVLTLWICLRLKKKKAQRHEKINISHNSFLFTQVSPGRNGRGRVINGQCGHMPWTLKVAEHVRLVSGTRLGIIITFYISVRKRLLRSYSARNLQVSHFLWSINLLMRVMWRAMQIGKFWEQTYSTGNRFAYITVSVCFLETSPYICKSSYKQLDTK